MATTADLTARLFAKFSKVPNVTEADALTWLNEATALHGYDTPDLVPNADIGALILLAQAEGCRSIALSVAHYFSYTDGDESVDKTMLVTQYRNMASDFENAYLKYKPSTSGAGGGAKATWSTITRVDR